MYSLFLVWILASTSYADLLADRYTNAEIWITRSANATHMNAAYADNVTTSSVYHVIRDVGDFGPKVLALEYDNLVIDIGQFIGFDPYILAPHWDRSTTKWVGTNTLQVDFIINYTTSFNFTSQSYDIIQQGFRYRELVVFEPNSAMINLGYSITDPAAALLLRQTAINTPIDFICAGVIIPACNGTAESGYRPYLNETGFTTVQECLDFLNSIPLFDSYCPYGYRSNTVACRTVHGLSAFKLPQIHCAHVRRQSMVCSDLCLTSCSGCDANAECVATFPTLYTPVYTCQCKNGYTGNGQTCTPVACPYGSCPTLFGSFDCVSGLCMCKDTFTHNPAATSTSNSLCQCADGGQIVYNNGLPICVPVGRCLANQWECNVQSYNQVKCSTYGNNTFTKYKHCLCNYGFTGGWEYACGCPSPKRVVWSNSIGGDVCLTTNECTTNWHCGWPKVCSIPSGATVGSCVNP